jgi:hypothetical protein
MTFTTSRLIRRSATAGLLLATLAGLSACSTVGGSADAADAQRDESSGQITTAAESNVFSLAVGDCLDASTLASGEIASVGTIPCGDEHDAEIYAELELPAGEFPGDDSIGDQSDEFCFNEFGTFVGIGYDESSLDFYSLTPTETTWDELDDRIIQCVIESPSRVTDSLAGSAL